MKEIRIEVVPHFSELYRRAIGLRFKILRQPLGLFFSREQFEQECDQIHVVAYDDEKIVGNLCFIPMAGNIYRMRQVAVSEECQGSGIGRRIVRFSEDHVKRLNAREIFMHSRLTAVKFYKKLGYRTRGKIFTEVGIPHIEMFKYFRNS